MIELLSAAGMTARIYMQSKTREIACEFLRRRYQEGDQIAFCYYEIGWTHARTIGAMSQTYEETRLTIDDRPPLGSRDLFGARRGEYPIPDNGYTTNCRSCSAPIVWARTPSGKPVPLSLDPELVEERDGVRYAMCHFVDCPDAHEWHKPR